MALSDESLVSDVEYVAFVVFPAGDNGTPSAPLHRAVAAPRLRWVVSNCCVPAVVVVCDSERVCEFEFAVRKHDTV